MAGAPIGNQNAAKAKVWHAAIQRALERRDKCRVDGIQEIDALADKLIDLVASGDLPALKEFGDRMDGKPAQAVELAGSLNVRDASQLSDDELAALVTGK